MNASAPEFTPTKDAETPKESVQSEPVVVAPAATDPSQSLWKPRYIGIIKSYSDTKGFGFIECERARTAFGRDVFIHKNEVDAIGGLQMGTEVQFEIDLNKNGQPQARNVIAIKSDTSGSAATAIETMLNECQNSYQVYEVVSMHNAELTHFEVVLALHQLAAARKYEGWQANVPPLLARALVDRLMTDSPEVLSMQDMTRIVYAVAALHEVQTTQVRKYIFEGVAKEIQNRVVSFSPGQMTNLIGCMSQLRRTKREDEVVGELTQSYSQVLGTPANNFPPEDAHIWAMFLSCIVRKDFSYTQWGVPPPVSGMPLLGSMAGGPLPMY